MGLDASVRCRCWEEGKTAPFAFADRLHIDKDGRLNLDLPRTGKHEKAHQQFYRWLESCCPHPGAWLVDERIDSWSGVNDFKRALKTVNEARFKTLLSQIPARNGGITQPTDAQQCLLELDIFTSITEFGEQVCLVDDTMGRRVRHSIEGDSGVFAYAGRNERLGLDRNGLFVKAPDGAELFRSTEFEQIVHGADAFEFRDDWRRISVRSSIGIATYSGVRADGSWIPHYPRYLKVEVTPNSAKEYQETTDSLRIVFDASVSSGNPVVWF